MPTKKQQPPPVQHDDAIRDRIKELLRVPGPELLANQRNWREHPYAQRVAIQESLERLGISNALLGYYSERNNGKLTLIDGHARLEEEPELVWPVLLLDVDDEEADALLLTLDPMTGMAEANSKKLAELLADVGPAGTPGLEDLLQQLRSQTLETEEAIEQAEASNGPPEMALQAFEHYDYVVLLFGNGLDWSAAKEILGIENEGFTMRDGETRKIGLGRVVDGKTAIARVIEHGAKHGQPAAG
ncbi:MAG TPA: hypothetical protein VG265_11945 [Gaiellaceae bacterium]|jgi:hypothetical protein|nr:hypothetical protein [Gaiellaceae bacterium]